MKLKEKLSNMKTRLSQHPITLWGIKHRRLCFVSLGFILLVTLILTIFFLKPVKVLPYTATYDVETFITFGDVSRSQREKVVISRMNNLYKSERFVNDIGLLESTYNTPDGFIRCSQKEDFDCQRLGDALAKHVGRPPKVDGLTISAPVARTVDVETQSRACHETTYTLPSASDKNALVQDLTASVCIDDALKIPLTAHITVHYRVNDITELKDITVEQTRTMTHLNTTPNLTASEFTAPANE